MPASREDIEKLKAGAASLHPTGDPSATAGEIVIAQAFVLIVELLADIRTELAVVSTRFENGGDPR
jgi:hypothetical protein